MSDKKLENLKEEETGPQTGGELLSQNMKNKLDTIDGEITDEMVTTMYPLDEKWMFYYDTGFNPKINSDPKELSKAILSTALKKRPINTQLQFWKFWQPFKPHKLPVYSNLRFFKRSVPPLFNHPRNSKGGRWVFTFTNMQKRENYWTEILVSLISNTVFTDSEDVVGAVFMTRARFDCIQIWIGSKNEDKRLQKEVHEKVFKLITNVHPINKGRLFSRFQSHNEANPSNDVVGMTPTTPSTSHNRSPLTPTTPRKDHYFSKSLMKPKTPQSPTSYLDTLRSDKDSTLSEKVTREPIRRLKEHKASTFKKNSPLTIATVESRSNYKFHKDDIELIPVAQRSVGTPTTTRQSQPEISFKGDDICFIGN